MSGVEAAAGLFLGVLPLVISAIEHYDDMLRPFLSYRNFTSRAQKIYDELETERAIFCTECRLLLSTVAQRDIIPRMLDNPNHPSWNDQVVCQRFGYRLGSSGAACSSIICKIKVNLDDIGKKCEQFGAANLIPAQVRHIKSLAYVPSCPKTRTYADRVDQGIMFGDSVWRRRVGKKLKFAFSESGLLESINELRKLNKTFLTITNQIVRLDGQSSCFLASSQAGQCINETSQEIKKFRIVQQASRQLHEALNPTCTVHAQHLALLCSEATCNIYGGGSRHPEIQFKLAITHNHSNADPINSSLAECDTGGTMPFSLEQRTLSSNRDQIRKQVDSTNSGRHSRPPVSVCNLSWFEVQTITSRHGIASQQVSTKDSFVIDVASQTKPSLGILEEKESCIHFIYGPSTCIPRGPHNKSISLAQLLAQECDNGPIGGLPQYQRLYLAKALALAVLQFHATPWLGTKWRSDDIVFYSVAKPEPQQQEPRLVPHLNAIITPTRLETDPMGETDTSPSSLLAPSIAPNGLLFSFGVILLEIAYGAPFKYLQQSEDIVASPDNRFTDFVTARRLADGVGTSLGAAFASIVRKCLRCDFGCGEDLNDPLLQARLYEDVVCKLGALEDGFRRLQVSI